jgi:uncharacterized membrane protein YhaH (DUF805 family)
MNWYLEVLRKYAVFSGRSRRKEYWFFVLIDTIVYTFLSIVDIVSDIIIYGEWSSETSVGFATIIYVLLTIIPRIALMVRRLHDTGKSGFWLFSLIIPPIGIIILFIFSVLDSDHGDNKYGQNPNLSTT